MNNIEVRERVDGKPTIVGLHILEDGETRELNFTDFTQFKHDIHPQINDKVITKEEAISSYKTKEIYCKADSGHETFWVTIKDRVKDTLVCKIDNDLVMSKEHGLKNGDTIVIHENCTPLYADFN